jgi:PAS domain-containing protein
MEIELVEERADDLSFGIAGLRNNALRLNAEKDLKASYNLLETTLESTADAIVVTTLTGDILQFNQKFAELWDVPLTFLTSSSFGQLIDYVSNQLEDPAELCKLTKAMNIAPEAAFKNEIVEKDGRVIELIAHPHYMDNDIVGRVSSLRDITEQKNHENQLTHLATHDELTGLPNSNLLNDRLSQAISYAASSEQTICCTVF